MSVKRVMTAGNGGLECVARLSIGVVDQAATRVEWKKVEPHMARAVMSKDTYERWE
ncbi:hypothetical protein TRAPUB_9867 [Trametes pubescens]|uniref:Uncharacterized protein n=1 Tax=Trametes pubescens TaxID=154538 RepID=A0A1M2W1B2_TRAPU|nr:hypothetical protein TRAPUB_9867 [Trametes pubescens]